jgi:hypothetical protein
MSLGLGFILIGGVLLGMGVSKLWHTKSTIKLPKELQSERRKYYTMGQLWWISVKKNFRGSSKLSR